nr:LysR substrate-binding domain-containing protein [Aliamphritea spongicola]
MVWRRPAPNAALAVETFELPCVCAMPKDDPLASREYIQPRDIADQPLAVLQEDHPNLIATRRAFKAAKAGFNPRFELRNFQPALTLVEEGLCYTICDPMTASSYFDYREGSRNWCFGHFCRWYRCRYQFCNRPTVRHPGLPQPSLISCGRTCSASPGSSRTDSPGSSRNS